MARKAAGVPSTGSNARTAQNHRPKLRIITHKPRAGFFHPVSKRDILSRLKRVGPKAFYGLRSVELCRSETGGLAPLFGRYCAPDRIILFEQPLLPWRLPLLLKRSARMRLERAGAAVTLLSEVGATLVDWPKDALRRFMLEEVLLHELGHHMLQHYKGKRSERVARKRDHEAFAERFVNRQRTAGTKGSRG